jgi:hypothetical protein
MSDENPLVCNVQGPVKFPDQKMAKFQQIPKATDLPSALRAIQAITNNFNTLMRAGNFVELRQFRTFTTNRVFNPENTEQWVDVQQITGLVFQDPVTGRYLTWRQ